MTRTESYLIFNALRLVGPVRVRKLREVFGRVEDILGLPTAKMAGVEGEKVVVWLSVDCGFPR